MFREIRRSERVTDEDRRRLEEEKRQKELYRNIKPETNITYEETKVFWNDLFNSMS